MDTRVAPLILSFTALTLGAFTVNANLRDEAIYTEAEVPNYALPPVLEMQDGTRISTAEKWNSQRRPEILRLFEDHVYGRMPTAEVSATYVVRELEPINEGKVRRKWITMTLFRDGESAEAYLLMHLPAEKSGPVPTFVGLNFLGNAGTTVEEDIPLLPGRTRDVVTAQEAEKLMDGRAKRAQRWPAEMITDEGFAVVTCFYGDFFPDDNDGYARSMQRLFPEDQRGPGQHQWGAIGTWAWGLSRILDYLETDPDIDATRVAVVGHSRLGKAALWAGATDERFALVYSNNSGCGGAALSMRAFGETVNIINGYFPHWFCHQFREYNRNEKALPVDQHQLLALVAPRLLYVASAEEDVWADPRGEYLALVEAAPAFKLLGKDPVEDQEMPEVNAPIHKDTGYHIRPGKHNLLPEDWRFLIDFWKKHLDSK